MQEGSGTYDLKLAHCCSGALAGKWLADVSGGPKSEVARHQRHVSLSVNSFQACGVNPMYVLEESSAPAWDVKAFHLRSKGFQRLLSPLLRG